MVVVHLSGTHQSPIRIKAVGTVREEPFPAPGSFEPQKTVGARSCPIDRPLSASGQRSYRYLACGRVDRAIPFLAHDRGVPACKAGAAFGAAVPLAFRRGKAGTIPFEQQGTANTEKDRKRRPNQDQWFEAKHLSGLAAPSSVDYRLI